MKRIVMLGGGTAGTIMANRLRRALRQTVAGGRTKADFVEEMEAIITVGDFYGLAAGGQIVFTRSRPCRALTQKLLGSSPSASKRSANRRRWHDQPRYCTLTGSNPSRDPEAVRTSRRYSPAAVGKNSTSIVSPMSSV